MDELHHSAAEEVEAPEDEAFVEVEPREIDLKQHPLRELAGEDNATIDGTKPLPQPLSTTARWLVFMVLDVQST